VGLVGRRREDLREIRAVEEAQKLRAAWVGDVVELEPDGSVRRTVRAVLEAHRQDVAAADLGRLHVFHGGVRMVHGVGDLHGRARAAEVDDVDARARAGFAPLPDEGEVLVTRHVAVDAEVERVELERAHDREVAAAPLPMRAARRALIRASSPQVTDASYSAPAVPL
jgi:hypothetical protein